MLAEPLKFDHDPHVSAEHSLVTMGRHPVGAKVFGTLFIRDLPSSNLSGRPWGQKTSFKIGSGFLFWR
jgi:hypothetical protein